MTVTADQLRALYETTLMPQADGLRINYCVLTAARKPGIVVVSFSRPGSVRPFGAPAVPLTR